MLPLGSPSCGPTSPFPTAVGEGSVPAPSLTASALGSVTISMSRQYKILLYSLDGRLLSAFCAYEWSLGIKSVAWSPSSQFLAVGSYDGKVGGRPRGEAHGQCPSGSDHVVSTPPHPTPPTPRHRCGFLTT